MSAAKFPNQSTIFCFFLFIISFVACGPAGEGSEQIDGTDSPAIPQPLPTAGVAALEGCYRMLIKQDTAGLQLKISSDSVSGKLYYHWHERDHNDGEITGRIKDSIIHATYRFRSEGMTSVREVIFKIKGDTLYQAYGEVVPVKDTMRFRFPELVVYDTKNPFVRIACTDTGLGVAR